MIRVFIADDHEIVRSGLRRLISDTPEMTVCGEADTAVGLVERARAEQWDVLILDINMPESRGPATVQALTRMNPALAVVVFTMYPEDSHAMAYMRAGAKAFLTKRRPIRDLLEAIHVVHGGERYITPALAQYLFETGIDLDQSPSSLLSPREREVIVGLAAGKRAKEIADELGISASTVSTHVQRIKEKLGVRSIVEIVEFARANDLLG